MKYTTDLQGIHIHSRHCRYAITIEPRPTRMCWSLVRVHVALLAVVLIAGPKWSSRCVARAAGPGNALRASSPGDAELKKLMRSVVTDPSGQAKNSRDGGFKVRPGAAQMDRTALMEALAESLGYGGEGAVDNLRASLGSINDDMASLRPDVLADSFARTIAGALSLSLAVASPPTNEASNEIIVHAVGAAEGREGAALGHMTSYLSAVDFGDSSQRKNVRIVMIGPEWSESAHKHTTVVQTESDQVGIASVMTYRGLYSAETLHDLGLPPPTAVICFNCDIYHCHWRPSLLFMIAQAR